jgi:hypothetical protein
MHECNVLVRLGRLINFLPINAKVLIDHKGNASRDEEGTGVMKSFSFTHGQGE